MGSLLTRQTHSLQERVVYNKDDLNGLRMSDVFIAPELLENILCMVDSKTVIRSCRLVCKTWQELIDNPVFWHEKCRRDNIPLPVLNETLSSELDWRYCALTYFKNPYGRSLIRNGSGQRQLMEWELLSRGGDGWRIESPPGGADELPSEIVLRDGNFCFATSFYTCSKQQVIDLFEEGVLPELLDAGLLSITVEDWYAGRFDCGCVYELQVQLLDDTGIEVLDSFEVRQEIDQWQGRAWNKVTHTFGQLPKGIRFVKFCHEGRDTQFWAGHYGAKMAGAAVFVHQSAEQI